MSKSLIIFPKMIAYKNHYRGCCFNGMTIYIFGATRVPRRFYHPKREPTFSAQTEELFCYNFLWVSKTKTIQTLLDTTFHQQETGSWPGSCFHQVCAELLFNHHWGVIIPVERREEGGRETDNKYEALPYLRWCTWDLGTLNYIKNPIWVDCSKIQYNEWKL